MATVDVARRGRARMAGAKRPNILVTGTPGTGKSTTCQLVAEATGLRHINVGDLVKAADLHCGWDEEFGAFIMDEDKVRHALRLCTPPDVCMALESRGVCCCCSLQAQCLQPAGEAWGITRGPGVGSTRCATRWRTTWMSAAASSITTAATSSQKGRTHSTGALAYNGLAQRLDALACLLVGGSISSLSCRPTTRSCTIGWNKGATGIM